MTGNNARSAELLVRALETLQVSVCICDAQLDDLPLVWVNDAFQALTGYQRSSVLGRNCRFLQEGLPDQPQLTFIRAALAAQEPATAVLRNRRADGTLFDNELVLTPLHDDAGLLTHYLALQRDVTAEIRAVAEAAELQAEQADVSRSMQANLAPRRLPDSPGLDVAVGFRPSATTADGSAVSGDFYDLYAASGAIGGAATWNAAIGDVAGRGAAAAAYTDTVRNILKGIGLGGDSPSRALKLLNSALLDELGDRFVTVALAQLRIRQDSVRVKLALGGHPQPVLVRGGEAEFVGQPGDLLGVLPDAEAVDQALRLQPGDTLLMYSDGVTEAGPANDMFGDERLLTTAADAAGDAAAIVDRVLHAVGQHHPDADDDIALLALRAKPVD
ncbi:MAG: hypothetical protein NVS3B26_28910 [Mycobacteriales bacterium]